MTQGCSGTFFGTLHTTPALVPVRRSCCQYPLILATMAGTDIEIAAPVSIRHQWDMLEPSRRCCGSDMSRTQSTHRRPGNLAILPFTTDCQAPGHGCCSGVCGLSRLICTHDGRNAWLCLVWSSQNVVPWKKLASSKATLVR